jgi:hypothetical protein
MEAEGSVWYVYTRDVSWCSACCIVTGSCRLRRYQPQSQQLHNGRIECDADLGHGGPYHPVAGKQRYFQRDVSLERPMPGAGFGGIGKLELDRRRSLGTSFGHANNAGNSHLHGGGCQSGHDNSNCRNRPGIHRSSYAYLPVDAAELPRVCRCPVACRSVAVRSCLLCSPAFRQAKR